MPPPASTQSSSSPKLTLNDLPPEIVLHIIEHVEHLSIQDHHRLSHPDVPAPGANGAPLGNAGDALFAMMNGLFGGALGANGGGPGAGAAAGGAGADAGNANAANPFAFNGPGAANPFAPAQPAAPPAPASADSDTDEDMPPLEAIPGSQPAAASASTATAATQPADDSDNDSMPPLESVGNTAPAPANNAGAASSANPFSFLSALTNPLFGRNNNSTTPQSTPTPATPAPATSRPSAQRVTSSTTDDSIYDDMPPLESVVPAVSSSTPAGRAPPTTRPDTDDEMPPLEPIPSSATSRPAAATADSDEDMPPLEAIDDVPARSAAPASSAAPARASSTAAAADSDDDMPPLEPIDRSGTDGALAGVAGGGQSEEESDGDGDDEDEDEDEDDWEDEDEDADDEDESDDEAEKTYPDGLPLDPLLPLLFINRPFLHASRKTLYRKVHLISAYQASRFRESLSSETPAAYVEGEELVGIAGDGQPVKKNHLADFVKHLWIEPEGLLSLGRGGGQIYIDIIRMCQYLETLVLRPQFLKSATKPLLEALASASRLKTIDFGSSFDPKHPFRITTPRLHKLMQQSWLDLENLVVVDLRPAEDGPSFEEDEMWDLVDELENEEWLRKREAEKLKEGDKKDKVGDDSESEEPRKEKETEPKEIAKDEASAEVAKKRKKPHGLKSLQLFGFNLTGSEMDLILQDSRRTLQMLLLQKPGYLFSRYELASTLLTFGTRLTVLDLNLPANWDPAPKPVAGFPKPAFPVRPKDYKTGKPTCAHLSKIADYTYVLDVVLGYLPNLKNLSFVGPYASTSVFSAFPPSLTHISFGRCPSIQPKPLATLLNKNVTRQKVLTRADGSKYTKAFQTKVARGMTCLTVIDDDLSWSDAEIRAMEDATALRNCCLHLSSDSPTGTGGVIPIPLNLGGLFGGGLGGLGGLGGHAPAGGANANGGGVAGGVFAAPPPAAPRAQPGGGAAAAVRVNVGAPAPRAAAQPAAANAPAAPANANAGANANPAAPARPNANAAAPARPGAGAGLAAGLAGLAGRWANNGGR